MRAGNERIYNRSYPFAESPPQNPPLADQGRIPGNEAADHTDGCLDLETSEALAAAVHAYNLITSDYIRRVDLWPVFARYFDIPLGAAHTVKLVDVMADRDAVWDHIVRRHGLAPWPYDRAALWAYADYI